jgi:hypothetical protein
VLVRAESYLKPGYLIREQRVSAPSDVSIWENTKGGGIQLAHNNNVEIYRRPVARFVDPPGAGNRYGI